MIGVSPGRVSQYIAEGKLGGAALEGEGARAKIVVDVALQQLGRSLEPSQMLGRPALQSVPESEAGLPFAANLSRPLNDQEKYQRAKAEGAMMDNERKRREMAQEMGRFMLAESAGAEFGKVLGEVLLNLEMALPDFAAVAAKACGFPDVKLVTIALKQRFRDWRAEQAELAAKTTLELPEHLPDPEAPQEPSEAEIAEAAEAEATPE